MNYKFLSISHPLLSPRQLLFRLISPQTSQDISRNITVMTSYIGPNLNDETNINQRVKELTDYIKERIESHHECPIILEELHLLFVDTLLKIIPNDVFVKIHPKHLTLASYFSCRPRDTEDLKPHVSLASKTIVLKATKKLRGGFFGEIKDAMMGDETVAIKRVNLGRKENYNAQALTFSARESWIMSQLKNDNILTYKGRFKYGDGKSPRLDVELQNPELKAMLYELKIRDTDVCDTLKFATMYEYVTPLTSDSVKTYSWNTSISMLNDISKALTWLHEKGWTHGNVNIENVGLTSNGVFKLFDMSLALKINEELSPDVLPYDIKWIGGKYPSLEAIYIRACDFRVMSSEDEPVIPILDRDSHRMGCFPMRTISKTLLQRIDIFSFGVTIIDTLGSYFLNIFNAQPVYSPDHHNFNFKKSLITQTETPNCDINPVFHFMNDVSLYTTGMYYQLKDVRWLSSLIDDCILIPDNNPVYMPKIAMILEEQKKLIDAKSDGWVVL